MGGVMINETLDDAYYNLPLVLAFSLLDYALSELLTDPPGLLGQKMEASKGVLQWHDYELVERGRIKRNVQWDMKPACCQYPKLSIYRRHRSRVEGLGRSLARATPMLPPERSRFLPGLHVMGLFSWRKIRILKAVTA